MGVRHLQRFMDRQLKNGTYHVQMEQEIRNAQKGTEKPLIVIDLTALYVIFCNDMHAGLCGTQIRRVERTIDLFFTRLVGAGAELVFFVNGKLQPSSFENWTAHQNDKYDEMIKITDAINARLPLEQVVATFARNIPSNTCLNLRRIAKRHGRIVSSTDFEFDQSLAIYASNHNALAIIVHDTSFLIYAGPWQLWHANRINLNTLDAQAFNRQALLKTLKLQREQMPIWATLAGSDFFKYDELEPFLNDLGPHHQKFYKLAEYVRTLPIKKQLDAKTVHCILERVYKNRRMPTEAFEWFQQSVAFYQIDTPSAVRVQKEDPFAFLLQAEQFFAYRIMNGVPIKGTLLFFDYRTNELGNYYEIIEPIVARCGGVLFYHHRQERQHITMVVKRNHHESHTFVDVPVIFPSTITPPPIKDLLSKDANLLTSLRERKLQLLRWVCSDDLTNRKEFNSIPVSLLLTVLVLYRLHQCGAISMFEVNLLLLIAHQVSMDMFDPVAEPYPYQLDPRAFRLGFLFQKVYEQFRHVAKVFGLPEEYRPSAPYDGLRFHNYYNMFRSARLGPNHLQIMKGWHFDKQT